MSKTHIFEFSGMPKSGKSTIIELVSNYFRRRGFKVSVHSDDGTYAPISKNDIGALNLYLGFQASEYILENIYSQQDDQRIAIIDRGVFDRCVFSDTLFSLGKIGAQEDALVKSIFSSPRLSSSITRVFVFHANVDECIYRELKYSLSQKEGVVMNNAFLHKFKESLSNITNNFSEAFPNVSMIDTSVLDGRIRETAKMVATSIEEDLHIKGFAVHADIANKFSVKNNTIVLEKLDDNKIGPYVISHKGELYYRYMDLLYHRKKPHQMTPDDSIDICDIRADLFSDIVDIDLNKTIVSICTETLIQDQLIPNGAKILDFGCGTGLSIELIRSAITATDCNIYGLDVSKKAVKICRDRSIDAYHYQSGNSIPFEDATYDLIFAIFVMHFDVPSSDLKELRRVVKTNGILVFNLYNADVSEIGQKLVEAGWLFPIEVISPRLNNNHRIYMAKPII